MSDLGPCDLCHERPATMQLFDDIYGLILENPDVCAECAEREWDREQERKMEG